MSEEEREEFLRRENELQDQITQKESDLTLARDELEVTQEELKFYKENETTMLGVRTFSAFEFF
jgi:kinesin family protein 5